MNEPIATFECPFGTEHTVPGDDVRVLRSGESNFLVACGCSPVPLAAAHLPHEHVWRFLDLDVDANSHLGFVDGTAPSSEQWLTLEELADGWYNDDPWQWLPEYNATPATLRDEMREQVREIADASAAAASGGAGAVDEQARAVACPTCGVDADQKCERPGGHSVRKCHSDRVDRAREEGVVDDTDEAEETPATEQAALEGWA